MMELEGQVLAHLEKQKRLEVIMMKKAWVLLSMLVIVGLMAFIFSWIECGGKKGTVQDWWMYQSYGTYGPYSQVGEGRYPVCGVGDQ